MNFPIPEVLYTREELPSRFVFYVNVGMSSKPVVDSIVKYWVDIFTKELDDRPAFLGSKDTFIVIPIYEGETRLEQFF